MDSRLDRFRADPNVLQISVSAKKFQDNHLFSFLANARLTLARKRERVICLEILETESGRSSVKAFKIRIMCTSASYKHKRQFLQ